MHPEFLHRNYRPFFIFVPNIIPMKKFVLSSLILFTCFQIYAQDTFNVYNPKADAQAEIAAAVTQAQAENKHVFIQVGGNWCPWCKSFHDLTSTDPELKSFIDQNYVVVHVNYSPENKNLETLASLDYPQRFGFPVFVILDAEGQRIHTQNSAYLEDGKGHSKEKIQQFLQQWAPSALDPIHYQK